jgi:hypothetical protein
MDNFMKLQAAAARFGKRGLAKRLNISEAALYLALRERRGLRPDYMETIDSLLQSGGKSIEMSGNASSVALEPPQDQTRSDTAVERQLIAEWTLGLSKDELMKVIAFIAEIKANRPANS